MKISGKKGIAVILKIILVIIFVVCILSMAITPIFLKQGAITKEKLGATIICIYISSIPALVMLYQFIKIFSSLEKEVVFSRTIENRFLVTSICSIIIGIIYGINVIVMPNKIAQFEYSAIIAYVFFSIVTAMIFLILGIGLIVLKSIYKTAIENKEENDLTI